MFPRHDSKPASPWTLSKLYWGAHFRALCAPPRTRRPRPRRPIPPSSLEKNERIRPGTDIKSVPCDGRRSDLCVATRKGTCLGPRRRSNCLTGFLLDGLVSCLLRRLCARRACLTPVLLRSSLSSRSTLRRPTACSSPTGSVLRQRDRVARSHGRKGSQRGRESPRKSGGRVRRWWPWPPTESATRQDARGPDPAPLPRNLSLFLGPCRLFRLSSGSPHAISYHNRLFACFSLMRTAR